MLPDFQELTFCREKQKKKKKNLHIPKRARLVMAGSTLGPLAGDGYRGLPSSGVCSLHRPTLPPLQSALKNTAVIPQRWSMRLHFITAQKYRLPRRQV